MPVCSKLPIQKPTRVIDSTDVFIETPSSCRSQSTTFPYKDHNTAKCLIGISPSRYPTFEVCMLVELVTKTLQMTDCGILKQLEPGDELMADRGFEIESDIPNGFH